MSFVEIDFPVECVDRSSQSGPRWNVSIVRQDSGRRTGTERSPGPIWFYDVGTAISNNNEDMRAVFEFAAAIGTSGFRFFDVMDHSTDPTRITPANITPLDVQLGVGDGSTKVFQLISKYTAGTRSYSRPLRKIHPDYPVQVAINGVTTAAYTVDLTSGLITFTTAPAAAAVITAGCAFKVPVSFTEDTLRSLLGNWNLPRGGTVSSIGMEEVLFDTTIPPLEIGAGTALYPAMTNSVSFTLVSGRLQVFDPSVGGLTATVPLLSTLGTGGPFFYVTNVSGANSINVIAAEDNSVIVTLAPGDAKQLLIGVDSSGDPYWIVF